MKKIFILFCLIILSTLQVFADSFDENENIKRGYLNMTFWEKFNDEILLDNLLRVYENNNDLKAAVLKVDEGQRAVKMSFANELPHVGFQGYVGQIFNSSDELFGDVVIPDYTETHFLFPLTMNYELDLWGQNHLRTKMKKKQWEMLKQDERSAYILITPVFAADYFNLIKADKLIEYQKELIEIEEKLVSFYEKRFEAGVATLSDVNAAKKNLTYAQEELRLLLEKQDILKNKLALLLSDRSFSDIKRAEYDGMKFDVYVPAAISPELLEDRPDRIKSELELERTGIDIKIAKRDFLPKFLITGDIGFNFYNLSSSHKFLADIGVVPSLDLFTGGRKIQMLKLKKDRHEIAVQHWEKTILTSVKETNDALYSLKTAQNIMSVVDDRLDKDIKECSYVRIREEAGTADNLDILLRDERLISTQKQVVSSKINTLIAALNLYQALGGKDFTDLENI